MRYYLLVLCLLFSGTGWACPDVPDDFAEVADSLRDEPAAALAVIEPLAECGYAPAQYWLGFAYYKVYGKPLDYEKSFIWYMRAANQGYVPAQMDVANAYGIGAGVGKSWRSAVYWYRQVAIKGSDSLHARAQHSIATALPDAYAVAAYMWASIALDNGWSIADTTINDLAKVMSEQEIEFARNCAMQCMHSAECDCDGLNNLVAD